MRFLAILALLLQVARPPTPQRPPPGSTIKQRPVASASAPATCPVTEAYFNSKFGDWALVGTYFVSCDPKPVWLIGVGFNDGGGFVSLGGFELNYTTKNVIEYNGGYGVMNTWPTTTEGLDACYAFMFPHCPA